MRAYINGQWFNVDDGATITTTFNETLDSASIRISHQYEPMSNLEPFDEVKLEYTESGSTQTKWFCIDSFVETRKAFDSENQAYYTYDIELFSPTKILENTLLPNISITPYKLGRTPLTIIQFINRIMNQYCPKYWTGASYQKKYTIDLSVSNNSKFSEKCPELQWTTPTLREVLNDLFMLCDCIPYLDLESNTIKALDLSQTSGYEVDYDDVNYIQRTQNSNDYASELKMNLQNVMQTDITDVRTVVNTYEALSFVTDNFIVTDNNYYLQTKFPILRIKHLWVNWATNTRLADDTEQILFLRVDLCNLQFSQDDRTYSLVVEKKEYDVLPVKKYVALVQESTTSIADFANNKNNCCYYVRGSNIISGFTASQKVNVLGMTNSGLERILWAAEHDVSNTATLKQVWSRITDWDNAYFHPTFEIEYETSMGCIFSASKNKKLKHDRTIMDNQTNAWVDINAQSKLEYLKADRISNKMYLMNARKDSTERYIHIGDVYDNDKIVYNTTWQFNQNNCLVNAYATEKYVLRDYFTGIDSKIRTWINAEEEAFIRHELKKYYITATLQPRKRETELSSNWFNMYEQNGVIYFDDTWLLSPLIPASYLSGKFLRRAFVRTKQDSNYYPSQSEQYDIEISSRYANKSILITTGFNDNRVAVKKVSTGNHTVSGDQTKDDGIVDRTDLSAIYNPALIAQTAISSLGVLPDADFQYKISKANLGGIPLISYMYSNEEGAFEQITIDYSGEHAAALFPNNLAPVDDNDSRWYYFNRLNNQINNSMSSVFKGVYDYYKDNREIFQITTQFEFMSDTSDIILTEDFVRMHQMIFNGTYGDWNDFTYSYIDINGNEYFVSGHHGIYQDSDTDVLNRIEIEINDTITGIPEWYCIYRQGKLLVKTKYLTFYIEMRVER